MRQNNQDVHFAYLLFLSLVAGLGGFLFGYDTAVVSGTNQQVALRHIYEREFAIGTSLLLHFLLTLWLLWQRWRIERKNRSLVQQIERSISDKQALQEARQTLLALQTADRQPVPQPSGQPTSPVSEPEPKANPEANASDLQSEQLFQQIDAYIRREQLFVQPTFSPDQLLLQFFILTIK